MIAAAAGLAEARQERAPEAFVELAGQDRDHGLGADDEIAARGIDLRHGRGERLGDQARLELLLLRHVALQQRDGERAARRGEVDPAEQRAGDERDDERRAGRAARRGRGVSGEKPK